MKYLSVLKMCLLFTVLYLSVGHVGRRVRKWGCMCVKEARDSELHLRETQGREGWVTTLLVPPLAIQFCPNNSRLKYHAETFHISSLRSFWQLTSCSLLFFAMMAWVSHRAFSITLPTAMLPAVQGSTSVPQPKLYHRVHFPLTWHCRDFKSY